MGRGIWHILHIKEHIIINNRGLKLELGAQPPAPSSFQGRSQDLEMAGGTSPLPLLSILPLLSLLLPPIPSLPFHFLTSPIVPSPPLPSSFLPSFSSPLPLEVGSVLRLRSLGERLKRPSPAAKQFLVNFKLKIAHLVAIVSKSFSGNAIHDRA